MSAMAPTATMPTMVPRPVESDSESASDLAEAELVAFRNHYQLEGQSRVS